MTIYFKDGHAEDWTDIIAVINDNTMIIFNKTQNPLTSFPVDTVERFEW